MTEVKIYYCKICKERGKEFSGIRPTVRKHILEVHRMKKKLSNFIVTEKFK